MNGLACQETSRNCRYYFYVASGDSAGFLTSRLFAVSASMNRWVDGHDESEGSDILVRRGLQTVTFLSTEIAHANQ